MVSSFGLYEMVTGFCLHDIVTGFGLHKMVTGFCMHGMVTGFGLHDMNGSVFVADTANDDDDSGLPRGPPDGRQLGLPHRECRQNGNALPHPVVPRFICPNPYLCLCLSASHAFPLCLTGCLCVYYMSLCISNE